MFGVPPSSDGQEPVNSNLGGCEEQTGSRMAPEMQTMSGSSVLETSFIANGASECQVMCSETAYLERASKSRTSLTRWRTLETPHHQDDNGQNCSTTVTDCSATYPEEGCPHPFQSLASTDFQESDASLISETQGKTAADECGKATAVIDPQRPIVPRAVVLLSKISVTRDELLHLLKFVPIEILMAEPTESPPTVTRCPLRPIDFACDRCSLPLLEEYCRVFLLRISRFYLVLLSTTIAIRVVVATEPGSREGSKSYTVAFCRGMVGGDPYQLDGSWIGMRRRLNNDGHTESLVSIGMTMRLFAESLGKTCVKVPLHGVSNRVIWATDLEEALNETSKTESSANDAGSDVPVPDVVNGSLADLERRALALQYLKRFAVCLEALCYALPLLRCSRHDMDTDTNGARTSRRDSIPSPAVSSEVVENHLDDDDEGVEITEEQRVYSLFENAALTREQRDRDRDETEAFSSERRLRNEIRLLLKEMQTRLFEAAFISKQKSVDDIATVERSLKKVIHGMEAANNSNSSGMGEPTVASDDAAC